MRFLAMFLIIAAVLGCSTAAPPEDNVSKSIPDANGKPPPPPPGGTVGPDGRVQTPDGH